MMRVTPVLTALGLFGLLSQPVLAADPAALAASAAAPATDTAKPPEGTPPTAGTSASARPSMDSLMFTTDELNEIRGRIASGGETDTNARRQAIEDATLYLSTIVYGGPKDWTIWVNGVPIGPDQEFQSFQVTDINANSVQLLVPLSAQGMRPVRLSPNQTYITKTGAVVEGQYK